MKLYFFAGFLGCMMMILSAQAAEEKHVEEVQSDKTPITIMIPAKLFYPVKRYIKPMFQGEVSGIQVKTGDTVKKGEELFRYRLSPQSRLDLAKRLQSEKIIHWEIQLASNQVQLSEESGKLKKLLKKSKQMLTHGENEDLAIQIESAQTVVRSLSRQRALLSKQLEMEKALLRDQKLMLEDQLGRTLQPDALPWDVAAISPIDGHVIWIAPGLRSGSELSERSPVIAVGTVDPMVLLAEVFEQEALTLTLGDRAVFKPDSIPGKNFAAVVSAISWVPSSNGIIEPTYYNVEFAVPNSKKLLREGLRGQIRITKSDDMR